MLYYQCLHFIHKYFILWIKCHYRVRWFPVQSNKLLFVFVNLFLTKNFFFSIDSTNIKLTLSKVNVACQTDEALVSEVVNMDTDDDESEIDDGEEEKRVKRHHKWILYPTKFTVYASNSKNGHFKKIDELNISRKGEGGEPEKKRVTLPSSLAVACNRPSRPSQNLIAIVHQKITNRWHPLQVHFTDFIKELHWASTALSNYCTSTPNNPPPVHSLWGRLPKPIHNWQMVNSTIRSPYLVSSRPVPCPKGGHQILQIGAPQRVLRETTWHFGHVLHILPSFCVPIFLPNITSVTKKWRKMAPISLIISLRHH